MIDPYFKVEVLGFTPVPQQIVYAALHQDYCEEWVYDDLTFVANQGIWNEEKVSRKSTAEAECGERVVRNLLKGGKGHYGPLEHPQIIFNCGWFPHSTMQQIRTHRVGVSIDCQSMRYTGQRIIDAAKGDLDIEEVFYLRPVGTYSDRQGKHCEYGSDHREWHKSKCLRAAQDYALDIANGLSEEHARGLIPFDIRQHWVISFNLRSLMHLLLIRGKKDAQLECQQLCELILPHFEAWTPQIYEWFEENLWLKGRLAP